MADETKDAAVEALPPVEGAEEDGLTGKAPRKQSWQAKVAFLVVAVVAAVALFWPRGDGTFEEPGGFLYDSDGRPATLGEHLAPVTLLHFWATWCPPCITEIPSLDRLEADVDSSDFAILMVAVNDEVSKVETFMGERAASNFYDPNWDVSHRYETYKLPETYLLVGRTVVDKFVGAQNWDDPKLRRRIEEKVREHRPEEPAIFRDGP